MKKNEAGKKKKRLQMNTRMNKVANSSKNFSDKKLSELLELFGSKRCRSM